MRGSGVRFWGEWGVGHRVRGAGDGLVYGAIYGHMFNLFVGFALALFGGLVKVQLFARFTIFCITGCFTCGCYLIMPTILLVLQYYRYW